MVQRMSKSELIAKLDCREMDLRNLINELMVDVQTVGGDELARALRHVSDVIGTALSNVGYASHAVRQLGDW